MKTTFEQFKASREELTAEQFIDKYGYQFEPSWNGATVTTVHSYDGYYILQWDDKFDVTFWRTSKDFDNLQEAELFFWEEFAKHELNH